MKKKEISPRDLLSWMIMFRQIILFLFFIFLSSQSFADQNDKRLNRLFDKLIVAEDQLEIEKLTQQIWKIWHEIDDPKMTRAFETGVQMMNLGFHSRAIDYFDKVIMEIPNFAEAWNKRATAHFMMGNREKWTTLLKLTPLPSPPSLIHSCHATPPHGAA